MRRIAIFQHDLGMGGIQKSLLNLLNKLDYSKYEVDLYLFSKENFFLEKIPKEVTMIYEKNAPYKRFLPFRFLSRKTKITKQYDIAIDYNGYTPECAQGALSVHAKVKIAWIHDDVLLKYHYNFHYRILYHFFHHKYAYFDKIVCVSEGAKEGFQKKNH